MTTRETEKERRKRRKKNKEIKIIYEKGFMTKNPHQMEGSREGKGGNK